jgi:hypothetical protein
MPDRPLSIRLNGMVTSDEIIIVRNIIGSSRKKGRNAFRGAGRDAKPSARKFSPG